MKFKFTKMHGCGNDYIYFDCINGPELPNVKETSIKLSDRHCGIGGDGIILICKSNIADAKMRMFNLDGSEGKMCGNGIRCVAKYLFDKKIVDKENFTIETLSGIKNVKVSCTNGFADLITINMGKANLKTCEIPVRIKEENAINYPLEIDGKVYNVTCVSMGNPHCIVFCESDPDNIDLYKIGPKFENHEIFPEKVNTEFIEVLDANTLKMRVWERGSGETFACGTGACAAVVAAIENKFCKKNENIKVILKGGELSINYKDDNVFMTGPATTVFEGNIEL